MFDTIILLTGPVEQTTLGDLLRAHNPQLTLQPVVTAEDFAGLDAAILRRSRLVAFSTPVIVPADLLKGLGYGAYNFHPGPPHYPGWAPAHFALYGGATTFGATANANTPASEAASPISMVARRPMWSERSPKPSSVATTTIG